MSRRTERPYKVDGTGELAPHSEAQCSVPEINGPVVQQKFTFLLRETCCRAPSATAGAAVSNGRRAAAGVSRGRSTESNEPEHKPGWPHNSGRAELGRQNRTIGGLVPRCVEADWPSTGQRPPWQRKSGCSIRQDCQEPPDADPHVRWCGRRGRNPPADPIGQQELAAPQGQVFPTAGLTSEGCALSSRAPARNKPRCVRAATAKCRAAPRIARGPQYRASGTSNHEWLLSIIHSFGE
jgi:hypothetical protein